MSFTIEMQNLDKLLGRFERYKGEAKKAAWRGVQRTGFEVKNEARFNAPVGTPTGGTLKGSIQVTNENPQNLTLIVQTTQPSRAYAAYQEFGFQGAMIVGQHTREITQVFGRPLTTPRQVTVRAHTRFYNYAGYGYMATARLKGQTRIEPNVRAELAAVKL